MSIKAYIVGMLCPRISTEELEEIRETARQHAQLSAGAYVESYEQETRRIMATACARFTGQTTNGDGDTPIGIEVSKPEEDEWFELAETYAAMTRPELFKECKVKEIPTTRTDKIEDLIHKLVEYHQEKKAFLGNAV